MTAEAALLLESGWAAPLTEPRAAVRAAAPAGGLARPRTPRSHGTRGARSARLPTVAWQAARDALRHGPPVLVQVPRRGYQPRLACADCRTPARCADLRRAAAPRPATDAVAGLPLVRPAGGRLDLPGLRHAPAAGRRRRRPAHGRGARPRLPRRAGPHLRPRRACSPRSPPEPALVVATPGAEPVADGGYGAVLLLDGWALLGRADLRAGEEALRRWLLAAALARPGPVRAVARSWSPPTPRCRPSRRCCAGTRPGTPGASWPTATAVSFPPAVRMAALTGTSEAIADLLATPTLPAGRRGARAAPGRRHARPELDGGEPVSAPWSGCPAAQGAELAVALKAAMSVRSARKALGSGTGRARPGRPRLSHPCRPSGRSVPGSAAYP